MKFNLQFFAPEPISTLTNTKWLLNSSVTTARLNNGNSISINFISNDTEYNRITINSLDGIYYGSDSVYHGKITFKWTNEAYRTITITGGKNADNEELIEWLQNNATFLEFTPPIEEEPDELWQIKKSTLKEVADAIRFRKNSTENIKVSDLATEISNITQSSGRTDVEYNKPIANDEVWQIKKSTLKGIANAIREKSGILDEFKVSTFAQKIDTMTITGEDHEEVGGAVKTYGVSWINDTSTTMERTDNAVGMNCNYNSSARTITSDFNNVFPYNQMERVTDDNGNVFVYIPAMWFRITQDSNGYIDSVAVSSEKGSGDNWYQTKAFYYGAYGASVNNNILKSVSDTERINNTKPYDMREYAKANGEKYHLSDLYSHTILMFLWWIEWAEKTCSSILQYGSTTLTNTGGTNNLSVPSGYGTNNQLKWHNIEDYIGNYMEYIDGYNSYYVTSDYTLYKNGWVRNVAGWKKLAFTPDGSQGRYTIGFGWDSNNPFLVIPAKGVATQTETGFKTGDLIAFDYPMVRVGMSYKYRYNDYGPAYFKTIYAEQTDTQGARVGDDTGYRLMKEV